MSRFPDKFFSLNIFRYRSDGTWYTSNSFKFDKSIFGFNYCLDIDILSRCDSLIASGSQRTWAAIILNNHKNDFLKVIDIGIYE